MVIEMLGSIHSFSGFRCRHTHWPKGIAALLPSPPGSWYYPGGRFRPHPLVCWQVPLGYDVNTGFYPSKVRSRRSRRSTLPSALDPADGDEGRMSQGNTRIDGGEATDDGAVSMLVVVIQLSNRFWKEHDEVMMA